MGRREWDVWDGIHLHYQLDSDTVTLRLSAVFVLLLQLEQFTLPALCMPMDRTAAACHDSHTPPVGAAVAAAQTPGSCAQASMCSAPANSLPALRFAVIGSPESGLIDVVAVATAIPADPLAPPAPPPQA
jgi:hypothetical protein